MTVPFRRLPATAACVESFSGRPSMPPQAHLQKPSKEAECVLEFSGDKWDKKSYFYKMSGIACGDSVMGFWEVRYD